VVKILFDLEIIYISNDDFKELINYLDSIGYVEGWSSHEELWNAFLDEKNPVYFLSNTQTTDQNIKEAYNWCKKRIRLNKLNKVK
jgi:hypothetical protein